MKALAHGMAWWPGMDGDIAEMVKECHQCQVNSKSPAANLSLSCLNSSGMKVLSLAVSEILLGSAKVSGPIVVLKHT